MPFESVAITFVIPAFAPLIVILVFEELIVLVTKGLLKLQEHLLAPFSLIVNALPFLIV